jgi:hypothetical protein
MSNHNHDDELIRRLLKRFGLSSHADDYDDATIDHLLKELEASGEPVPGALLKAHHRRLKRLLDDSRKAYTVDRLQRRFAPQHYKDR